MNIEDFAAKNNLSLPQVRNWAYRGLITWTAFSINMKKKQLIIVEDAKTLNYLYKREKRTHSYPKKSSFKRYESMILNYNQ